MSFQRTFGNPYEYVKLACDNTAQHEKGTFTSGTAISVYGYSPCIIANLSGLSGSASCAVSANAYWTILGFKSDGTYQLVSSGFATSRTFSFADYDFIVILAGNDRRLTLTTTFTIT